MVRANLVPRSPTGQANPLRDLGTRLGEGSIYDVGAPLAHTLSLEEPKESLVSTVANYRTQSNWRPTKNMLYLRSGHFADFGI